MSEQSKNDVRDAPLDRRVPLRNWLEDEAKELISAKQRGNFDQRCHKETIIRKTTIAYGIAELLRHARAHPSALASPLSVREQCRTDNFVVHVSEDVSVPTPNNISGVQMLSPRLSVNIIEPSFLRSGFSDFDDDMADQMARYLEAEFPTLSAADATTASAVSQSEEDAYCHSFGSLLHEIFSPLSPQQAAGFGGGERRPLNHGDASESELVRDDTVGQEPAHKKARQLLDTESSSGNCGPSCAYVPLHNQGVPTSISTLVQNLLECSEENRPDDAYYSLGAVIKDLHLLLLDPSRFLFDHRPILKNGRTQLSFRRNKLYGRGKEVTSITDAFCRVSAGKSEAFFLGGFAGSGKSMLVNSLTAQIDIAEGYVLTHKFDQISKERPLLELIDVFNDLCLLIQEKSSPHDMVRIINKLMDVFETDLSVLVRLIPSVCVLSPQFEETPIEKEIGDQTKNLASVCFVLQRFMRAVSSKEHPVMIFLDDLQWCDSSALTLIEGIICDVIGSGCLFFVGSYRDNEVQDDHDIFSLMDNLACSGVPTTKLNLEGLNSEDLNTMISDGMGMLPRICKPLSDIVFQKTKGNPFFVLQFLRSLVDEGLLEYSVQHRRWLWNQNRISSMEITGNVLHLLSSKMSSLSATIQLALKVSSCFGTKIKGSVIQYLSTYQEFSSIRNGLEQVVREGFMIKIGSSDFKFAHDKVQEAAYGLIPDRDKNRYHYNIGISLYSMSKGCDADDIRLTIANQINHGIEDSLAQSPELRIELAELNEMAGAKAVGCSDYSTARSYLNIAMSLLPADHWNSHYDLSLRLSFLLAKSAYSCGYMEETNELLQSILHEARCLNDKLDAYLLVVMILHDKEATEEAFKKTQEVLLQLGETIPTMFGPQKTKVMLRGTSELLNGLSEESLLGMKQADRKSGYIIKFYSCMTMISYSAKPGLMPFCTCRMIHLTMKHGFCKFSLLGFVLHAASLCINDMISDIQEACRIGKVAMAVLKKIESPTDLASKIYHIYYGFVALHSEKVQSCADNIHRGFECGIACGVITSGSFCAVHQIRLSLIAGSNLASLLKRTEYYLEVIKRLDNPHAETYLLLYRDTISSIMGVGCNHYSEVQENASRFPEEVVLYHKAMRAYWIGHSERCHHFTEKMIQGCESGGGQFRVFFMLYFGLNMFKIIRRTSPQEMKAIPRNCLRALKKAMELSRWNFRNKVHLLEAEILAYEGRQEEAKASYAAAISSARCSKFIHEEGLACELAGFHYKKMGDNRSAWDFFNQAKQCYSDWGSQIKVDKITRQLETCQVSLT